MFRSALVSFEKRMFDDLWAETEVWEAKAQLPDGWSWEDRDENLDLLHQARKAEEQNPSEALALELKAAEHGSALALGLLGWRYWSGTGVDVNKERAAELYRQALDGGHQTAVIGFARLLFDLGRHGEWENLLLEAAKDGFVPAFFWLAWLRYNKDRSARVRSEVTPLLRFAADRGHPMAGFILNRWMAKGYLGPYKIPLGLIFGLRWAFSSKAGLTAEARTQGPATATQS